MFQLESSFCNSRSLDHCGIIENEASDNAGEPIGGIARYRKILHTRIIRLIMVCLPAISCLLARVEAGSTYPGQEWEVIKRAEDYGFSSEGLVAAQELSTRLSTSAVVVVYNGKILCDWGHVHDKFITHSMRKSFMSALYGIFVAKGIIDLDRTLEDLEIDDIPPLTENEKKATVRQCLMARSGIYHPAAAETQAMKALRPERGAHPNGEFWYYNNWDFNVLCTILEQEIGKGFFEALKDEITDKIQMEDFEISDGAYKNSDASTHPAYHFRMTPRDMARFGLLMLRRGQWQGNEIIPSSWIDESTDYYSDASLFGVDGYGYMWWVARNGNQFPHLPFVNLPEGSYSARGAYGQYILIIPAYDLVIVHCVDTSEKGNSVSAGGMGLLVRKILESMNYEKPMIYSANLDDYTGTYSLRQDVTIAVSMEGDRLFLQRTGLPREEAFWESQDTFQLAKNSVQVKFVRSENGVVERMVLYQLNRETVATKIH